MEDELIDTLYSQLYHAVVDSVVNETRNSERVNPLLWVGHNLERLEDRVTNICERVIFVATGRLGEIATHDTAYFYQVSNA
jgi:phosphate transport system protein